MNAATIAGLLITFGPQAIELIQKLSALWSKAELSDQEIADILAVAQKPYDAYINEANAAIAEQLPPK